MSPNPPGRDTTILGLVIVVGLAVMALAPPGPVAPTSAARVVRANARDGSGSAGAAPSTVADSGGTHTPDTGGAATPTASSTGTATATETAGGGGTTTSRPKRIKLMDTRYAKYSYLISNETLTNDAERALDGFRRNRTRVNASTVRITLIPEEPQYQRYSVLVRDDQKLYFIETSFGDDAPHRETQLDDDAPVKVDSDGYLVQ